MTTTAAVTQPAPPQGGKCIREAKKIFSTNPAAWTATDWKQVHPEHLAWARKPDGAPYPYLVSGAGATLAATAFDAKQGRIVFRDAINQLGAAITAIAAPPLDTDGIPRIPPDVFTLAKESKKRAHDGGALATAPPPKVVAAPAPVAEPHDTVEVLAAGTWSQPQQQPQQPQQQQRSRAPPTYALAAAGIITETRAAMIAPVVPPDTPQQHSDMLDAARTMAAQWNTASIDDLLRGPDYWIHWACVKVLLLSFEVELPRVRTYDDRLMLTRPRDLLRPENLTVGVQHPLSLLGSPTVVWTQPHLAHVTGMLADETMRDLVETVHAEYMGLTIEAAIKKLVADYAPDSDPQMAFDYINDAIIALTVAVFDL